MNKPINKRLSIYGAITVVSEKNIDKQVFERMIKNDRNRQTNEQYIHSLLKTREEEHFISQKPLPVLNLFYCNSVNSNSTSCGVWPIEVNITLMKLKGADSSI